MKGLRLLLLFALLPLMSCVTIKSGLSGQFHQSGKPNLKADPVSVLFVFDHVRQIEGLDVVPKVVQQRENVTGFDDIFNDALHELTNIKRFDTFTRSAQDVNTPKIRAKLDSLRTANDFTIETRIIAKNSFAKYFLGTLLSTVSLTTIPVPYSMHFELETKVFDSSQRLLGTYSRSTKLTKWVQCLLIFAYPFYPEQREREKVYMEFLHDTFRQIDSEGILRKIA